MGSQLSADKCSRFPLSVTDEMSQKSSPLEREGLLKRVVQYQALAFPKGIGTGQALRERHRQWLL